MAKKKKSPKKKLTETWQRRTRVIKGKKRYIWVRKMNGKIETSVHRPEIHGIALAKKVQAQRPKKAQKRDKARTSKRKIKPTDKNIRAWKKRPGSGDIKKVDTKR